MKDTISKVEEILIKNKIVSRIINCSSYVKDQPPFYHFISIQNPDCDIPHSTAWRYGDGAVGMYEKNTKAKIVMKTAEKYSLFSLKSCNYIHATRKEIDYSFFPLEKYLESYFPQSLKDYSLNDKTAIGWVQSTNLSKQVKCYIPAQFLYPAYYGDITYDSRLEEPYFLGQYQIINGCAAMFDSETAKKNAILEAIERDAFVNMYINNWVPLIINNRSGVLKKSKELIQILSFYSIDTYIFDITLDIKIPVILVVLIDRKEGHNSLSYGYSCGVDIDRAASVSIEKAYLKHINAQVLLQNNKEKPFFTLLNKDCKFGDTKLKKGSKITRRAYDKFSYFFNKPFNTVKKLELNKRISTGSLDSFIEEINRNGYEIWERNVTEPCFKKTSLYVSKVFIPGLQEVLYDNRRGIIERRKQKIKEFLTSQNE